MGVIFITSKCKILTNGCKKHNKLYKTCKKECKKCAIFAHFIDIFLLTLQGGHPTAPLALLR